MTYPVPAYLYVLQGDLTVQFVDGRQQTIHAGQHFLQSRTQWHRGRNDGQQPVRFLAVFLDAKGIPTILHPPVTRSTREESTNRPRQPPGGHAGRQAVPAANGGRHCYDTAVGVINAGLCLLARRGFGHAQPEGSDP
jgi:hypothetical protein